MSDELTRVYRCDLPGCPFETSDPLVAASMVQMQVMIPAATGLNPIEGHYCTKAHALQAMRELPEPDALLNPAADEFAAPGPVG